MKIFIFSLAILLFPLSLYPCEILSEPYQLKNIQSGIDQESQGKFSAQNCQNFTMSKKEIKKWIKHARFVDQKDWENEPTRSPCYVSAELIKHGNVVQVKIWSDAMAKIVYWNGEPSYLINPKQKNKFQNFSQNLN